MGSPPRIEEATERLPGGFVHLARWLDVTASEPVELEVIWDGGDHVGELAVTERGAKHSVPILGMRADRQYEVRIVATNSSGVSSEPTTLLIDTEPLPDEFPAIDVVAHHPDRMEPGLTVFDVTNRDVRAQYLLALDGELEVVWYADQTWGDVRVSGHGTLIGQRAGGAYEMDFMGTELNHWAREGTTGIDFPKLHHEVFPLEDGSFLSLANGVHQMSDYPASHTDPAATQAGAVKTPIAVNIGADGSTLAQVDLGEVLDMYRIGFDSLTTEGGLLDWGHGNGIVPHADGSMIVSLRHQDAVVKVSRGGELVWILGDPGGWKPAFEPYLLEPIGPDFSWFYHQHSPEWSADGQLLLFDNGNHGQTPYAPEPPAERFYSRVAAYSIDEQAMTVRLDGSWDDFGPQSPQYAAAYGDADRQPQTGNILATFGSNVAEGDTDNADLGYGAWSVRIIEFDPEDSTHPAMDIRIVSDRELGPKGWWTYRAERIEALHLP